MAVLFFAHVTLFSGFALLLSAIPRPFRAVYLYCYLAVLLTFGGFLGSVYSLTLADGVVISGGNLLYGAFMVTSVLFVLAERDIFVLRRIVQLVVLVNVFVLSLSVLASRTLGAPGVVNQLGVPVGLFETSSFLIVLGGGMIVLELTFMAFVFEATKARIHSAVGIRITYLVIFVAVLCFDGLAFPIVAFGPSPETVAAAVGSLSGKLLTAVAYGLVVVSFSLIFQRRFSAYLDERVFSWRALLSPSGAILRDMERKDAQLAKARGRLAHSAELASLGYAVIDVKADRVVECDAIYADMHGLEREVLMAMPPSQIIETLIAEEDRKAVRDLIGAFSIEGKRALELRHITPDGSVRSLRKIYAPLPHEPGLTGSMIEVVGQDITEARLLQEQLFRSQKAEALGRLTGGVAHDFNNLLAVILGNLELHVLETEPAEREILIRNCIAATKRGADLTRSMLSFAQQAPLEPKIVNVNDIIEDLGRMTNRVLPASIEIAMDLRPNMPRVRVDPGMVESAVLNLILNARDAMPQGGRIEIKTTLVATENNRDERHPGELPPGRYLVLSVIDTGQGIAREKLPRIFEPFFTTKSPGAGSGLGLAMIDGFMRQSGGVVQVASVQGEGTQFDLYFPAVSDPTNASTSTQKYLEAQREMSKKTILLVEDDTDLRASLSKALSFSGHDVMEAADAEAALASFLASDHVDLVLTDVILPGPMQGPALLQALREHRPFLPAIVMSGNMTDQVAQTGSPQAEDIRLSKPIELAVLLDAIKQAFAVRPPSP
ncbi:MULTISPECIES: ATP-binding protein [Jannaschia]|uniref:ATP-binding protein n=1 Tax=Jannaschia TaxID=188905 RepID=UPI001C7DC3F3|nr:MULTISPECIES: ATP-binding protein [unclassified Jannaschia]